MPFTFTYSFKPVPMPSTMPSSMPSSMPIQIPNSMPSLMTSSMTNLVINKGITLTSLGLLPSGLTLLQYKNIDKDTDKESHPDTQRDNRLAIQLNPSLRDYGWLYSPGHDGQWVTYRKLSQEELDNAHNAQK